jgi:DNA polymerase/3'-5' exonuclease PolX
MKEFPKEELLNLNDDEFRSLIYEISSLAGGNPKSAEKLASDIPALKKQIDRMNENDARRLMQKLDKADDKKTEEILKKLNGF